MEISATNRRLSRLVVAIVQGRWDVVREVRAGAGPGEPDRAWREAVLQTHLFAGFPRLIEAYGVLEEAGGLGVPEPLEFELPVRDGASGRALFERIYADRSESVRLTLESHHADFARWIEEHAYGRVLARGGLEPARREILAVAALAALGQDRQLISHSRGAIRCGATAADLRSALGAAGDLLDSTCLDRALRILDRLAAEEGRS